MKYIFYIILFLIFLQSTAIGQPQSFEFEEEIHWKGLVKENPGPGSQNEYLYFPDAYTDPATTLPLFSKSFQIESEYDIIKAVIVSAVYAPFTAEEAAYISDLSFSLSEIEINSRVSVKRKVAYGVVSFIPIRFNNLTNNYEKLTSFQLLINVLPANKGSIKSIRSYAENSVLQSGEWYKLRVKESGIYKIGFDDLISYGIDPTSFYPQHIRIYGSVTGMLPEDNKIGRVDDLQELAIEVVGEDDGVFDPEDYILFYGTSPNTWHNVLGFFTYKINYYESNNYYYLTTSLGVGKRIEKDPAPATTPNQIVSTFNDYEVIEDDLVNLILSGKEWYGDEFGETLSREYYFQFPHIVTEEPVIIKTEIANRTFINETMDVYVNGTYQDSVILTSVNPSSTKYAQKKKKTLNYQAEGPEINIKLEYQPSTSSSKAWLDYIMINLRSELNLSDGQLLFRDLSSVLPGNTTQFHISNTNAEIRVWDITNPLNALRPEINLNQEMTSFIVSTDTLREFIAFDESNFYVPEFTEIVQNQNLHGEGPFDMVIVSHPLFYEEAEWIAYIHDSIDQLNIKTLTLDKIYNEFSGGKQDPTAIRDYVKMLYDRYEGQEPRFLLLFGDGSFDPKDRLENNSNFIPTFQNRESWITSSSYVIDDYFGYLDDTEGNDAVGDLDIGIGRFPVQTKEEAKIVLSKIENYISKGTPSFGSWRTRTTIIADDEDGNLHLEQADSLSRFIPNNYNQKKIFLDAYPQISTPSGERYPEVTAEISRQIEEGVLVVNYVGHGGKSGWAHERIIQTSDIQGWENENKLPVFITATCEFSRFDEPELNTGGEMVFLNPNGGGIALFTTTRLAYSQSNFSLNQRIYSRAFTRHDGEMPYLGDLILYSKPPGQLTTRNFILMGDPALKMAYPEYQVQTLAINGKDQQTENDTLRGLDKITVQGQITDHEGNKLENFNGVIYPVVYDKPKKYKTFGHDGSSYPIEFECQDLIIWQGKDTVVNGNFSFEFMVPLDISYDFGYGKISYYAHSDQSDAFGSVNNIIIGGINENAEQDNAGPEISLYINHDGFQSGETIYRDENQLYAYLFDKNGISLSENGMGHDIVLTIDEDSYNKIILNNSFISNSDNYTEGTIVYPLDKLPQGRHTLTLKAWDSYNNSSTVIIDFVIQYAELMNYPNPFANSTTFQYYHSGPSGNLDLYLDIYDVSGRLVTQIMPSEWEGTSGLPIYYYEWNGTNENGSKLDQGLYIYMITSIDQTTGETNRLTQKLLLQ